MHDEFVPIERAIREYVDPEAALAAITLQIAKIRTMRTVTEQFRFTTRHMIDNGADNDDIDSLLSIVLDDYIEVVLSMYQPMNLGSPEDFQDAVRAARDYLEVSTAMRKQHPQSQIAAVEHSPEGESL